MGHPRPPVIDLSESYNLKRKGRPPKDIIGQKFGKLTVEKYLGKSTWLVTCECGLSKPFPVLKHNLTAGKPKSCGCLYHPEWIQNQKEYDENFKLGIKYNFWTQVHRQGKKFVGRCLCGKQFKTTTNNPHSVLSCGCISPGKPWPKELFGTAKYRHEMFHVWTNIKKKAKQGKLPIDKLWAEDFVWFLGWVFSEPNYKEVFDPAYLGQKYVIRKDCNQGFSPANCHLSLYRGNAGRRKKIKTLT